MSERALAIDIVRGWGLEFDGTGDPKEFVGRIEDAAATYGIRLDHIAGAMRFLLKGNAINWWHSNALQMTDWITFKTQLNLHFVPDIPSGKHPYKRVFPLNRENLRKPWDASQQSGGGLTNRSNFKRSITSVEQVRTGQPYMKKTKFLTDCIRQQEDDMDLHPEDSWKENHGVPTTNPSKETVEIPQVIQEEALLKQARKRPGQRVNYKRSFEGKLYHVMVDRRGYLSISQLGPDQLSEDHRNQPQKNGPQLLADGGCRQQDGVIDIHTEKSRQEDLLTDCIGQQEDPEGSWEEDHELTNPSEGTTEIPLVIQREARWRQAQKRPGQQVFFEMSAKGKEYRIKISRSGNIEICQLKPEQVMDDQTNPSEEEATEIPLVIQEEARWMQSIKRPGKQLCYKRSVEGKEYRIKIARSGIVRFQRLQRTPDQLRDDQKEQPPMIRPQLITDGGTPELEDVLDIHAEETWEVDREVSFTNLSEEEATEIPLVIQEEARWMQSIKRPGKQLCYKRSVEGKEYRIKIARSGIVRFQRLQQTPDQLRDDQKEQPAVNEPQKLASGWPKNGQDSRCPTRVPCEDRSHRKLLH